MFVPLRSHPSRNPAQTLQNPQAAATEAQPSSAPPKPGPESPDAGRDADGPSDPEEPDEAGGAAKPLPFVRCEESLHLDYCPRRRRHLWEAATYTLRAIHVEAAGASRRYGPFDPWGEAMPDPRAAYRAVGTALVRPAAPGRDYDEGRHVTGLP